MFNSDYIWQTWVLSISYVSVPNFRKKKSNSYLNFILVFIGPMGTEVKNSLDRIYYWHSLQLYWKRLCKFRRKHVGRKGNTLQFLALLMCDLHKEARSSRRKCKTLKRRLCKREICIQTNWKDLDSWRNWYHPNT